MLTEIQKQQIQKQLQIQKLSQRAERYEYLGILSEYQLYAEKDSQKLDYTKLNPYQHFLFKRVLHGLNVYTPEQVNELHWDKKRRIKKVWQRAQDEVNKWKQVICAKKFNQIFSVFSKSPLGREILEIPVDEVDPEYVNKLTFKDLGINYEDLILFFMSKGLLPANFLDLKPQSEKGVI
jgi:hypothetical protein